MYLPTSERTHVAQSESKRLGTSHPVLSIEDGLEQGTLCGCKKKWGTFSVWIWDNVQDV